MSTPDGTPPTPAADETPAPTPDGPPAAGPQAPGQGLGRRAARGAAISVGGQVLRMAVQVGGVVVLAHLLSPHDYGLVAMVLVIVGVGDLFRDFGLSSAAIQARTLSRGQRTNLFWLNTGIGAVLALLTLAAAPLVAHLFEEPELTGIARALAPTFLLNGMATQFRADLTRRLRFGALAVVDIASPLAGLVLGVVLAVAGAGYWALVAQQLATAAVTLIGAVLAARWMPGLPRRGEPMRDLLTFGWNLLATQLVGYVTKNSDSFIIGLRFGPVDLGQYNRAFSLLMQPLTQLRGPSTTVALPVLSRLHGDPERFGEFVRRGQLALAYTLVAGLSLVVAAADPLTSILLGAQWERVTPILRFLALAGMFQTLAYVGYWIYLATGLTKVLLRYTLVTSVVRIACIVIGSTWGVVGVAAGYAFAPLLEWPLSLWWVSRHVTVPLRALLTGATRTLLLFGTAAAAGWALSTLVDGQWWQLVVAVGGAAAVAVPLMLLLPTLRRDVRDVAHMVRLARQRTPAAQAPVA